MVNSDGWVVSACVMESAAAPVFVTLKTCAELALPIDCVPKVRLAGNTVAAGAGETPIPTS
jgi:hypothetical protein